MKTAEIKWAANKEEITLIGKIAERYEALQRSYGVPVGNRMNLVMDLNAAHSNGCPIDFQRLLAADDGTFGHDVAGIQRHIDRETGELGGCFVPRTAKPQTKEV